MRLLVTGDRMWGRVPEGGQPTGQQVRQAKMEREYLELVLDTVNQSPGISELVIGDAKGTDEFARRWAISRNIPLAENLAGKRAPFKAEWDTEGKSAGYIRNQAMLDHADPDAVIAFHRDFLRSKGTKDMVDRSLKRGLMVSLHPTVSSF